MVKVEGKVVEEADKMASNNLWKRAWHKLFHCPTFWSLRPAYKCPECGKRYRCYWDGNDIKGHGINYCGKCAGKIIQDMYEGAQNGAT